MYFWNSGARSYDMVSYKDLVQRAFAFGLRLGDRHSSGKVCLIACHSPYATLVAFYGAISAGLIPMIFPMPRALGSNQALVSRIRHWGSRFEHTPILVLEYLAKEPA